jgi:hypothetical protein
MERKLVETCRNGDASEVADIIKNNPELDLNCVVQGYLTPIHECCYRGNAPLVKLLLSNSRVNVNTQTSIGYNPFMTACGLGRASVVKVMLKDNRVLITEPCMDGDTPLRKTLRGCDIPVFKQMIASGRDFGMDQSDIKNVGEWYLRPSGEPSYYSQTLELAEDFVRDPDSTRYKVRCEVGYFRELSAANFASVVFLCEDLLKVGPEHPAKTARFFSIAQRLPMELQMILCHRSVGSASDFILSSDSEVAFKELAKTC